MTEQRAHRQNQFAEEAEQAQHPVPVPDHEGADLFGQPDRAGQFGTGPGGWLL